MFQPIRKLFKSLKFNYLSLFLIGLSTILLFSFMYGSVKKETYELKSFQISPDTIRSLKTVEDTVKTEQDRERAANEVGPSYVFSEDVVKNRQAIATSLFDFLIEVKNSNEPDQTESEGIKSSKELVSEMRTKLSSLEKEEPSLRLSDDAISNLLSRVQMLC